MADGILLGELDLQVTTLGPGPSNTVAALPGVELEGYEDGRLSDRTVDEELPWWPPLAYDVV